MTDVAEMIVRGVSRMSQEVAESFEIRGSLRLCPTAQLCDTMAVKTCVPCFELPLQLEAILLCRYIIRYELRVQFTSCLS